MRPDAGSNAICTMAPNNDWLRSGSNFGPQKPPCPTTSNRCDGKCRKSWTIWSRPPRICRTYPEVSILRFSRGAALTPALKTLARRSTVPVELHLGVNGRLPDSVEVAAYYVVVESLTNAAKHAGASEVSVEVEADDDDLRLSICDDGSGGADWGRGSGLVGLRDRVEALGGRLLVSSPVGVGTSLMATIPLHAR